MSKKAAIKTMLLATTMLSTGAFASNSNEEFNDPSRVPLTTTTTMNTAQGINNSLFYVHANGPFRRIDPRVGHMTRISEDANNRFRNSVYDDINNISHIINQVRSGNYDQFANELASRTIECYIASLAGEAQNNIFSGPKKEIDTQILVKASMKLVNNFTKHLSKNPDLYGELDDGTRVTIYNRSLFKMIADAYIPKNPMTNVITSLLDNNTLKEYMTKKMMETVFGYLKGRLEAQGVTLKETLGQEAVKFGRSMMCDESSVDYKKLWGYLSPHLNYHLRNYLIPLLKEAKNSNTIKAMENDFMWNRVVFPAGGATAAAVYFAAGPALTTAGSFLRATPAWGTGMLLQTAGMFLNTSAGAFVGAVASGYVGGRQAQAYSLATKDYLHQYIDDRLERWAYDLIPYTREEHAHYALNKNAKEIERGLAYQDYQLRDELNSQTVIGQTLKSIFKTGWEKIRDSLFASNTPVKALNIKYCMNEEQEQAYRKFTHLMQNNPEEAKKIADNLEKFPSYEQKMKFLNHLKALTLDDIKRGEENGKEAITSSQRVVTQIRGVAGILVKELCAQDGNVKASRDPFYTAFTEEILTYPVELQDNIIKWVKDHRDELQTFVKEFVANKEYKGFVGTSLIEELDDDGNVKARQKFVNDETIKEFISQLMNTRVLKYIDQAELKYSKEYKYTLDRLKASPLTEGMTPQEIILLHKRLATQLGFWEHFGPDVAPQILGLLDDDTLKGISKVSREWHKLCSDILDERKIEKYMELKSLTSEERAYFDLHRHDIVMIEEYYRTLKLNHALYTLISFLSDHLNQTNALEKVKNDVLEDLIKKGGETPTVEDLTSFVLEKLQQNADYQNIRVLIKPIKDKDTILSERFNIERFKIAQAVAQEVINKLELHNEDITLVEYSQAPSSSASSMFSWFGRSSQNGPAQNPVPTLSQQDINERFAQAQKNLVVHVKKDVGHYNLLDVITQMFTDHSTLSVKDFIKVHQKILAHKLTNAKASDKSFIERYNKEIVPYKLMNPILRDRLFYGYEELIEAIRAQNLAFLKTLFSIPEKRGSAE